MKFEIKHRSDGSVLFTAEIDAGEGVPYGIRLGMAVKDAVLRDADLIPNFYGSNESALSDMKRLAEAEAAQ